MSDKKGSKLGLGIVLGTIAGAVAGLFLAPKQDKQLRKDAKKLSSNFINEVDKIKKELADKEPEEAIKIIFGKVTDESKDLYLKSKEQVATGLAQLHENYKTIGKAKYQKVVSEAVDSVKQDSHIPDEQLRKLMKYLEGDFKKLTARKQAAKKKTSRSKKV